MTDRRDEIEALLRDSSRSFEPEARVAAANALALLEIADAIDRLGAEVNGLASEVEKAGWAKA